MPRKSFLFLLLLSISVMTSIPLFSQSVQGVISGTVTDPSGAVVPGATVTIINTGTGASLVTTTVSGGEYRFPLVPPGTYNIEVKASGFGPAKADGITVSASQTVPLSFKLSVAASSAVVEVTSNTPLVQTETSDQSLQIDNATIQNMALVDRDVFTELPFLAPTAMPGLDTGVTAGGARESGTSFMLNGGEDNDNFGEGSANIHPPLESIQDFSVLTNNMSAEYGRGVGALITASQKSGTNKFHGVVYEFNRNASLNANDWFYNRTYSEDPNPAADGLSARPKYIRNQFGGEVDGPIYRDHTFFAAAYDRVKLLSGSTSAHNYVPTPAAIDYLKVHGGTIAQAILGAYPPSTSSDTSCLAGGVAPVEPDGLPSFVGCLSFFDPVTDTIDTYFGKVDQIFSAKDRLSFTINLSRELNQDTYGGGPLTSKGPIPASTNNHFHQLVFDETHAFGASLLNELIISHNRHYNVFEEGNGASDTTPNIYIDNGNEGGEGYYLGGAYEGGQVENFTQDRWALQENLSYLKGRHSFKFGFSTQWGILYRNWDLGLPGQYEFGELIATNCPTAGNCSVITPATDPNGSALQSDGTIANIQDTSLSNFAGDYPYFQETSTDPLAGGRANAYRHYTNHDYGVFVQDDFKVTPRLTLNLGLRWDRYGSPAEVHNQISQFVNFNTCDILEASCLATLRVGQVNRMWPTNNKDFGPRIGFAYDPFGDHKTAIRGGYGIAYDRIFDNIWSNGAWNPPFFALLDLTATPGANSIYYSNPTSIGSAYDPKGPCGPIPYPAGGACGGGFRAALRTMDVNMKDSYSENFYFGVEREVPGSLLFRVNYQGALGRHLPVLENLNRVDGDAANSTLSAVLPNALYNAFNYRANSVASNYHALVLQAQKRMSHGLQFDTSYTFSKLLDLNSELFAGCSTIGGQSSATYFTTQKNPQMQYGRSSFDHRSSFKFSTVYELPFFKAEKGFVGQAFGGWHLGSLFQFYTGHPVDVWDGRSKTRALSTSGGAALDRDGIPINLGGDYNLDGSANERPVFVGSNKKNVYSHATPANGIFKDNNLIGCGAPWVPGDVAQTGKVGSMYSIAACNARFGVVSPNSLFVTPPYPGPGVPTYERYNGLMGRDVFVGPSFAQLDLSLAKSFKIWERGTLDIRGQAQNLANHPNFDAVTGNLGSSNFGEAQQLLPFGTGEPKSRVLSVGARLAF